MGVLKLEKVELEKEKEKLNQTIKIIDEILNFEKVDLEKLYNNFVGNREELWDIADRKKLHISNLEVALNKPYFARIILHLKKMIRQVQFILEKMV